MHITKIKKGLLSVLILSLWIGGLSGCTGTKAEQDLTTTGFAFDTTYTITLYQGGSKKLLDSCIQKCSEYERIFSRTLESSELYQVNELEQLYKELVEVDEKLRKQWNGSFATASEEQSKKKENIRNRKIAYTDNERNGLISAMEERKSEKNKLVYQISKEGVLTVTISDMLRDMIEKGLEYARASEGSFDIAIEPVTSLWNFKAEEPVIPEKKEIDAALPFVDYQKLSLTGNSLSFQQPGMGIDLGGIAKGFIADELKQYLKKQGVTSALINLGGNVLCLGGKSEEADFRVGIQQPFADRNETIAAVKVRDLSIVSSGIYERYIEAEDGTLYHHIINPKTGYSYDNDLLGVTILSEKSVDGDGLSTTCFSLGREKGLSYINSLQGVYAMFITKDEKLWYSDGFEEFLLEE